MRVDARLNSAAVAAVLLVAATAPALAGSPTLATGSSWRNELGSVMTVTGNGSNGQFSGYYVTAVASPGCQAVGVQQPMSGWISASGAITFSVNWIAPGCASVTAWTGSITNGRISTIWTLSSSAGWSNMNIGSNIFTPVSN